MRRLYYIADDLSTTGALSESLREEGITDWNFHVLAKDEAGLYQRHIHSATTIHQLDIVHCGARWGIAGTLVGLLLGVVVYVTDVLPWTPTALTVMLFTLVGGLFGAWQGAMVGRSRENYKIEPYHDDIEAGRYLIMIDVKEHSKGRVSEIMNMGFPRVRFCGKDSTLINPFKKPRRVYAYTAR